MYIHTLKAKNSTLKNTYMYMYVGVQYQCTFVPTSACILHVQYVYKTILFNEYNSKHYYIESTCVHCSSVLLYIFL